MNLSIHASVDEANASAAELLAHWLGDSTTRNVMVAAGNTPLELYRRIGERKLNLSHLNIFALDEYVGVPLEEPRNCANLLRRAVGSAWGIPFTQFNEVSSLEHEALASVLRHEQRIIEAGGLDVLVLGLGQNGHLGFNEPGSAEDSPGRLLDLEDISTEANRKWFHGRYAPNKGVTVGMKTILGARRVIILAFGAHKTEAVKGMVEGPRGVQNPASFLQSHGDVHVFLDQAATAGLRKPS